MSRVIHTGQALVDVVAASRAATATRSRLVCGVVSARPPKGTPPWATTVAIPPLAA